MSHPRDLLLKLNANARKSLSQNFLTSPHWAENLARETAEAPGAEAIWEIGPGLGALTSQLVKLTSLPITLFEYDRKLAQYLRETFTHVDLREGDVLDADFTKIDEGKQRIAVLSNLPYHLSSAILFKLLDEKARILKAVLTFQKEFADRLVALPRTPDYGALSILMQLHFEIRSLGVIPPGAFFPQPAIDSKALSFHPLPIDFDAGEVKKVVKAAFAHRRKKISSNLKAVYPGKNFEAMLGELGIGAMARPEELSKEDFLRLTKLLISCT